jgi:hypothetical protein
MPKNPLYNEASKVKAVDGEVQVDGPDGVEIGLTPEAAMQTSDDLLTEAARARGQQMEAEQRRHR